MDKEEDQKLKKAPCKSVNSSGREGKPISLKPLSPEEAIRAILSVPPVVKDKHPKER
jgi:hypothetical protein